MSAVAKPRRDDADAVGHEHRDITGGWARAAVFGVSDGLTTNVALILGIAGASAPASFVRLAGLAGLIGGAFSMAAGEWVSMRAQTELLERELAKERRALARRPEAERRELAAIYVGRGIDRETANAMADQVMSDPETALEVHAREELGVNPTSLGSPTVVAAVILAAIAAVCVGAALARFTGRSVLFSAVRQLLVMGVAAGITYGIGHAVGLTGVG